MKISKDNKFMLLADVMLVLIIIVSITIVSLFFRARTAIYNDISYNMSKEWRTADGAEYALNELPIGDVVITHTLEGMNLNRMRFCCESTDTHFTVKFDGEVTYSYYTDQAAILGRSYGKFVHMIPIPPDSKTVTLELHPIYDGEAALIKQASVEDAGVFMADIYHDGLPKFAVCVLLTLFGALMIITGFTDKVTGESMINPFSLGAFAVFVGIWSANDTMILQVYTQHPEIVSFTRYLCLMFVVYLPVSFMASSTNHRDTILLPILLSLTLLNFLITMLLSALRISDMHLMLPFSHVNIVIALFMTIYLMVKAIRAKTIDKTFRQTVVVAMTFASLGVASDLLHYILTSGTLNDTSLFTRVGVFIFVALLGVYMIRKRTQLALKKERAQVIEKLAYTDSLTGLANRTAFHEKEDEIRQKNLGCIVIQLDINFLKKVNDVYGHSEGDRHIVGAAHIIRDSFADIGTAYRTGGDEFIVIVQNSSSNVVEKSLKKIEEGAKKYNAENDPPVPLQIAYGYAQCNRQNDVLEAAERLADQRMYEKKREMKTHAK